MPPRRAATPILAIDGLGKGSTPLDGPWQFHLGDNPAWALPQTPDATGSNGWEQITTSEGWGTQGHPSYVGFAWYRKHIDITPAPGAPPDIALFIPGVDDVYELYWNGVRVGGLGDRFSPHFAYYFLQFSADVWAWPDPQRRSGPARVYKDQPRLRLTMAPLAVSAPLR